MRPPFAAHVGMMDSEVACPAAAPLVDYASDGFNMFGNAANAGCGRPYQLTCHVPRQRPRSADELI